MDTNGEEEEDDDDCSSNCSNPDDDDDDASLSVLQHTFIRLSTNSSMSSVIFSSCMVFSFDISFVFFWGVCAIQLFRVFEEFRWISKLDFRRYDVMIQNIGCFEN